MERLFYILLVVFALVLLFHSWLLLSLSMKNKELEKRVQQLQRTSGPQLRNVNQRELKELSGRPGEGSIYKPTYKQKPGKRTRQR